MEKIVSFCQDWFEKYQPEGTRIEQVLWIFWAVWILLILVAVFRVIKFRLGLRREKKIWGDGSGPQKSTVVIVPIKGVTPSHTSDFFQSLLEQNYSNYRIIVAVETSDDPAAEWLCDQFGITLSNPVWAPETPGGGLQSIQFVVAGKCKGRGQKVHNQLAAFENLTPEDEILAFVDADIICPPDWLARLTAPINRGTHDPATTYRWLVPAKTRMVNLFASVINASVTTQGGNTRENMPWGGSMAISRTAFDDVNVPVLLQGSINDDLRIGKAAKKIGYKVGYVRNLVRPTEINFTWLGFFEFARRQYLQAKVFSPILYTCANLFFSIYFWGFVSIVTAIVMGYLWAWVPLIIATILDQIRAATRESIYRRLFGDNRDVYKRIAKTSIVEQLLTPVYMSLHGMIIVSTWFMNKVEWGGIKYQVEGVDRTRVLQRKPVESTVNLSSIGQLAVPAGGVFTALNTITHQEVSVSDATETVTQEPVESGVTLDETTPISVSAPKEESTVEETHELTDESANDSMDGTDLAPAIPAGASQFTIYDLLGSSPGDEEADGAEHEPVAAVREAEEDSSPEFTFEKLGTAPVDTVDEATNEEAEDDRETVAHSSGANHSPAVSAVPGIPSAVKVMGQGAPGFPAPAKTGTVRIHRRKPGKKKPAPRVYLAGRDRLSPSGFKRLARRT